MKTRALHQRQRGFSLSEAMISLTVLTSGLLALAQFQGELSRQTGATQNQALAVNLAQQKLEELRLLAAVDEPALTDGSDTPVSSGDGTVFQRRWTLLSHNDLGYREIRVRTEWTSLDGEQHATGVTSILTSGQAYSAEQDSGTELTPEAP